MKRQWILVLLLIPVVAAAAATVVYRWVDANGVVHYSDKPHPGAKKVDLSAPSVLDFKSSPESASPPPGNATAAQARHVDYNVRILSPADGTTLRPADWKVSVRVSVKPPLGEHASLEYALDGKQAGKRTQNTSVTLTKVYRGTHHLTVKVLGPNGRARAQAGSTFYVHHHSLLLNGGG